MLFASFSDLVIGVVSFVAALSVIVAVHEYGHYIVGRWSGIRAEVFSIGFGPRLWSRTDRRGTRWQIAAIPLGGYVKFLGDANAASAGVDEAAMASLSEAERRQTMHGAPLWARAATVAAGPVANFLLSILIFTAMVAVTGLPLDKPTVGALRPMPVETGLAPGDRILAVEGIETPDLAALAKAADAVPPLPLYDYRVERAGAEQVVPGPAPIPALVLGVQPRSAAVDAGLREGDVILSVDGERTPRFSDLKRLVGAAAGAPVTLEIWRDGTVFTATLKPRERPVPGADGELETGFLIGVSGGYWFTLATRAPSPAEALSLGLRSTWGVIDTTFAGLSSMIAQKISPCNLNGMIGIAQATGSAASQGLDYFIWLMAALSTAIGLVNLFPIPVLDGGHLVFHAWEWAFGRPPPDRVMNVAMAAGLMIVVALMLFGISNDLFCE
ncbi:RIP metalloprotease RseP [Albidovulum sp.]